MLLESVENVILKRIRASLFGRHMKNMWRSSPKARDAAEAKSEMNDQNENILVGITSLFKSKTMEAIMDYSDVEILDSLYIARSSANLPWQYWPQQG